MTRKARLVGRDNIKALEKLVVAVRAGERPAPITPPPVKQIEPNTRRDSGRERKRKRNN